MKQRQGVAVVLGLLFLMGTATTTYAVVIRDVKILGQPALPSSSPGNPASIPIGEGTGTVYGNTSDPSIIRIDPISTGSARVEGVENDISGTGRDQLNLVNARIVLINGNFAGQDLTIEFTGDFGEIPNGVQNFGGFMKGKFMRGGTVISGVCSITMNSSITVPKGGTPTPLPTATTSLCNFNKQLSTKSIDMGQGQERTHWVKITFRLPMLNDSLEFQEALPGSGTNEGIRSTGSTVPRPKRTKGPTQQPDK